MLPWVLHIRNTHPVQAERRQKSFCTIYPDIDSSAEERGENLTEILSLLSLVAASQTAEKVSGAVGSNLCSFCLSPPCVPLCSHSCIKKDPCLLGLVDVSQPNTTSHWTDKPFHTDEANCLSAEEKGRISSSKNSAFSFRWWDKHLLKSY